MSLLPNYNAVQVQMNTICSQTRSAHACYT